jgi:hypothetical protein
MIMNPPPELMITNATVVPADHLIDRGWVAVCGDRIAEIGAGSPPEPGIDFRGKRSRHYSTQTSFVEDK